MSDPLLPASGRRTPLGTVGLELYLVTDREACGRRGVAETVRRAVDGGVSVVQLRDKHADIDEHLRQLDALCEAIDGRAVLLVNDRLDVALAARARGLAVDGVHLGQGDEQVSLAREALGPEAIVGLTANTAAHLAVLVALPHGTIDYLGVGVIHPTSTKPDHPPALNVDGFARFAESAAPMPCVAIGGITYDDAAPLRRAGAAGIAVVSAICGARDPEAAARGLLDAWNGVSA